MLVGEVVEAVGNRQVAGAPGLARGADEREARAEVRLQAVELADTRPPPSPGSARGSSRRTGSSARRDGRTTAPPPSSRASRPSSSASPPSSATTDSTGRIARNWYAEECSSQTPCESRPRSVSSKRSRASSRHAGALGEDRQRAGEPEQAEVDEEPMVVGGVVAVRRQHPAVLVERVEQQRASRRGRGGPRRRRRAAGRRGTGCGRRRPCPPRPRPGSSASRAGSTRPSRPERQRPLEIAASPLDA